MISKIFFIGIITFCCFRTDAQQLSLILPKDNSFIQTGESASTFVKWSGNPYSEINFEFTLDNGQSWNPMKLSNYFPDDTTAIWYLPNTTSVFCKVKLSLKSDSSIYVINKLPFILTFIDYDYISINEILMWIGNNGMGSHLPNGSVAGFYWPGGDSATIHTGNIL